MNIRTYGYVYDHSQLGVWPTDSLSGDPVPGTLGGNTGGSVTSTVSTNGTVAARVVHLALTELVFSVRADLDVFQLGRFTAAADARHDCCGHIHTMSRINLLSDSMRAHTLVCMRVIVASQQL